MLRVAQGLAAKGLFSNRVVAHSLPSVGARAIATTVVFPEDIATALLKSSQRIEREPEHARAILDAEIERLGSIASTMHLALRAPLFDATSMFREAQNALMTSEHRGVLQSLEVATHSVSYDPSHPHAGPALCFSDELQTLYSQPRISSCQLLATLVRASQLPYVIVATGEEAARLKCRIDDSRASIVGEAQKLHAELTALLVSHGHAQLSDVRVGIGYDPTLVALVAGKLSRVFQDAEELPAQRLLALHHQVSYLMSSQPTDETRYCNFLSDALNAPLPYTEEERGKLEKELARVQSLTEAADEGLIVSHQPSYPGFGK